MSTTSPIAPTALLLHRGWLLAILFGLLLFCSHSQAQTSVRFIRYVAVSHNVGDLNWSHCPEASGYSLYRHFPGQEGFSLVATLADTHYLDTIHRAICADTVSYCVEAATPQGILRSDNGVAFLGHYINSFMSLKVEQTVDLDTHSMFICSVTEARVITDVETMTYTYYQNNVKPKPETDGKKGWVCKVCGYVYEGEDLPDDFICPLCKHGVADFEPIE